MTPFGSSYQTPGWQRAQARTQAATEGDEWRGGFSEASPFQTGAFGRGQRTRPGPQLIEGEVLARSTGAPSPYSEGARVLHLKFGPGTVAAIDGNKLTVDFDKAGRKMVLDSFVEATG
jgi:DNA helicase-2/ATP-dependent DNA helicase PcrA